MGLDTVSCVQAMVSRPIVVGPLAGLLLGDPVAGMWAGVVLEIVSLNQLPIGANRSWDTGPASVAAAVVVTGAPGGAAALLAATGFGVLVGWVGSWSVHAMRHVTAGLVANEGQLPMSPTGLAARHLTAVGIDWLRATLLTLLAIGFAALVASYLGQAPEELQGYASLIVLICVSLALTVDLRTLAKGRPVLTGFALGFLVSALASLWLR